MRDISTILPKYRYLPHAFSYILINNPSNDAPYHNLTHLVNVTQRCYYLSQETTNYGDNIEDLLFAAMFHDTNRTMGAVNNDAINTQRSVEFFHTYIETQEINVNWRTVEELIRSTKYPYDDIGELTLKQKILRDSDLLSFIEDDRFIKRIVGLSKEFNLGILNVIEKEIKFIESRTFYLPQTLELFGDKKEQWIDELKRYQKLLR